MITAETEEPVRFGNEADGRICAPVSGVVSTIAATRHAISIRGEEGEILVHAGINTVTMKGEGFVPQVREGDRVTQGQLILEADLDRIRALGLNPMVVVVRLAASWPNSWYPLEVVIKDGQDISAVETLLRENLPKIGETIPEIISGPVYKGIIGIGRGSFTLSVIAECDEEDYYSVGSKLNRAVIALFDEHGVFLA